VTPFTPKQPDIAAILPHVRYEIEQCFVVPRHDASDHHVRESVFLAILVHARLLLDFFEASSRYRDDVLCSDFGFATSRVPLSVADRTRLNKDIVHLTYSRLRHTPATKPWPVATILGALRPTVVAFIRHVLEHSPSDAQADELANWRTLYDAFTRPA
jgi:hypothetical protein